MVEEKVEPREYTWRQRMPWTEIFQGFRVALDFNKLLLAAAGILVMAFGWWLFSALYFSMFGGNPPTWRPDEGDQGPRRATARRHKRTSDPPYGASAYPSAPGDRALS